MSLSRFVPPPLLRSAKNRLSALFSSTPLLFLGVVIGVAVLFRLGIGLVKSSTEPEATAPLFTTTASPSSVAAAARSTGENAGTQPVKLNADPAAMPLPVEPPAKGKKHGRSQFPRR